MAEQTESVICNGEPCEGTYPECCGKAMTTPTNSDHLQPEIRAAIWKMRYLKGATQAQGNTDDYVEAIWPIIEAEINKLNAEKAETIEVLEELKTTESFGRWVVKRAEPHLDRLKGSW